MWKMILAFLAPFGLSAASLGQCPGDILRSICFKSLSGTQFQRRSQAIKRVFACSTIDVRPYFVRWVPAVGDVTSSTRISLIGKREDSGVQTMRMEIMSCRSNDEAFVALHSEDKGRQMTTDVQYL